MICPNCGIENVNPFGYCTACGKPLQMVAGAVPPPPPSLAADPQPPGVLGLLVMLVAVIVAVGGAVVAWKNFDGPETQAGGFLIGSLLSALGAPFLIAYLTVGRKKSRNPRAFVWIFSAVALIFGLSSVANNLDGLKQESTDQLVGRLMREAAGLQPVHSSLWPSRRRMEDTWRPMFKQMVDLNKQYMEDVNRLDTSAVSDLNTAKSFLQPEIGDRALQQIHAVYALDSTQEEKLGRILEDLRHSMETVTTSASEREAFMKGFDQGMKAGMSKRSVTVAAEKAWMEALDEEYDYARAHQSNLMERDGKVVIQGHEIVLEFNRRVDHQEELRKEFIEKQKEFSQFQASTLQKMGVKPQDIGRK
jgi:hypothetical protein